MNRVALSGWLSTRPLRSSVSGMAIAMLRLMVVRGPLEPDCEEVMAMVDCFAFREVATYLTAWGRPGDWLTLDGRLYQDRFELEDGRSETRLCVHIDAATLSTPIPRPASRSRAGQPSASPAAGPRDAHSIPVPPNGKDTLT